MYPRFTAQARKIVGDSMEEAKRLGQNDVLPEHLLLCLVRENDCVAARLLDELNIPVGHIRSEVDRQLTHGTAAPEHDVNFDRSTKHVLDLAFGEASSLNNNNVGTEHLLLALIKNGDGVASQVLLDNGADHDRVYGAVVERQSNLPN